ncbi:hypothetical protein [Chryseobacterium sp.]|uniref:hypothetical protein n=1 Tax=Chryseobacterium sp. TaxID=1871047 RepID=UPI0025C01C90|nr:hypothetical protein [Chryseobacterium sp.]
MKNKKFAFKGISYQTEIRISIITGVIIICLFPVFFMVLKNYGEYFLAKTLAFAGVTIGLSFLILRILMKFIKNKDWEVEIFNDQLTIKHGKDNWKIPLKDLKMIKNTGQTNFRYLTFITNNEKIKIRVGHGGFTPFSTEQDVEEIDKLFKYLLPYIKQHFNKKQVDAKMEDRKFPHFGEYVVKTEPIKYSLIDKMSPKMITIGTIILLFIFIVLVGSVVEAYIKYKSFGKLIWKDLSFAFVLPFLLGAFLVYGVWVYFLTRKKKFR